MYLRYHKFIKLPAKYLTNFTLKILILIFQAKFHDPKKAFNSALGIVVISYEEGKSASNQQLEIAFKAENSDFSNGNRYFYLLCKKDIKNFGKFIPIMRSEII